MHSDFQKKKEEYREMILVFFLFKIHSFSILKIKLSGFLIKNIIGKHLVLLFIFCIYILLNNKKNNNKENSLLFCNIESLKIEKKRNSKFSFIKII